MAAPKAIIFDLGNVLLPIDLMLTYQAFAAFSPLSELEIATKIKEVFYLEKYRDTLGIETLERAGIPCYQLELKDQ